MSVDNYSRVGELAIVSDMVTCACVTAGVVGVAWALAWAWVRRND